MGGQLPGSCLAATAQLHFWAKSHVETVQILLREWDFAKWELELTVSLGCPHSRTACSRSPSQTSRLSGAAHISIPSRVLLCTHIKYMYHTS